MTRAAGVVAAATLLSRILGFVRDAVIAWYFGAGFSSDAFLAAFRIPNLFRRLVGEGVMNSAVVPVFAETLHRGGPKRRSACSARPRACSPWRWRWSARWGFSAPTGS